MIKMISKISNIQLTNYILFILKNTPIIKYIFKDINTNNYIVKDGINKLISFLKITYLFLIKYLLFYLAYSVYIEIVWSYNQEQFILLLFLFEVMIGASLHIFDLGKRDFLFIKELRFNPKKYVNNKILLYSLRVFFQSLIGLLSLHNYVADFEVSYLMIFILSLSFVFIRIICEYCYLNKKYKAKLIEIKHWMLRFIVNFGLYMFFIFEFFDYAFYEFEFDLSINSIYIFLVIIFSLGSYLLYYILKKFDFNKLFNRYLIPEAISLLNSQTFYLSLDKQYKDKNTKVLSNKKGYHYLYDVFNKKFAKSLIVRSVTMPAWFSTLFLVMYFSIIKNIDTAEIEEAQIYIDLIHFMFYLAMFTSLNTSKDYLGLCFNKIDKYLNNYGFHNKNYLINILLKIKCIIKFDLVSALVVFIPFLFTKPCINNILLMILLIPIFELFNIALRMFCYYCFNKPMYSDDGKKIIYYDTILILIVNVALFSSSKNTYIFIATIIYLLAISFSFIFAILKKNKYIGGVKHGRG